jgi:hypothetical protein
VKIIIIISVHKLINAHICRAVPYRNVAREYYYLLSKGTSGNLFGEGMALGGGVRKIREIFHFFERVFL